MEVPASPMPSTFERQAFFMKNPIRPTSKQLAEATSTLWDYWHTDIVLDDSYREVNGTELDPGQFTGNEILKILDHVIWGWSAEIGVFGARQFMADLVERQLLVVQKATTRGKPAKYSMGMDTQTGDYFTRSRFLSVAHGYRAAAYKAAQARKAELAKDAPADTFTSDIGLTDLISTMEF